jgi:anaerobic ribonucleoside-triphosphate reductase
VGKTTIPDDLTSERLRRCGRCDVTWRGTATTGCWVCGSEGIIAAATRIVEDEPAA